jgi:hypothetical protein
MAIMIMFLAARLYQTLSIPNIHIILLANFLTIFKIYLKHKVLHKLL